MQSSCLVKYTTRSLYIRPCYGAIPAGHKGDRSSLPEVTKEASTSSSWTYMTEKIELVNLTINWKNLGDSRINCQPRCYAFQRYFGVNKVDPVSRVARILHGSLVKDVRMFLTYVTSLGDGQGCAATPAKGRDPYPGGTNPPGAPSPAPGAPPTFTALLSQRPLNRTIYKHSFAHNLAIDTLCILHTIMMPPILNIISSRFVDKSCRQIDLEFVSCAPGVIPGVCPSDFWISATRRRRETPGIERHHEGYFTRIGDKAHIVFASPAHFFFLIRTNGLMGPLSYDRNSP
ncbi:hypothetical protein ALC57_08775 [Trachymyrmex cornetzi]|uniref:Uncharacterized protein n=1 Tax=Trachymyrmex cornetzi TaxID=471704 RepID=A0A195E1X6_9HYME|nr:hypothetical protein ALC57_08775 [Trachymyrmex cornetzi]